MRQQGVVDGSNVFQVFIPDGDIEVPTGEYGLEG